MSSSPIVGAFVFPDFWENSSPREFEPGPFERLRRQRDHDGERQLRAFHVGRDAQCRTSLLCRRCLFLRPCLQFSLPMPSAPSCGLSSRTESAGRRWNGMSACRRPTAGARRRRLRRSGRLRGRTPWTGSFSILCVGRCTGKSSSGLGERGRSNSSFDAATLAKFEEATGRASARSRYDIRASRLDPRKSVGRVGRIQMQGRERFRQRGAERAERNEGRRGARNLRRAGRQRAYGAVDRPAHRGSRAVGRLDRAHALPQHLAATASAGSHRRSLLWSKIAGEKTLPVLQADSNRDPAVVGDWGPPMSDADWSETLSQVAGRSDIGGLIVFPGTALMGGRGASLRAMLGARR